MPNSEILVLLGQLAIYLVICHTIGCVVLLATRLKVPGIVPPYPLVGAAVLGVQLWAYGFAHIPWNAFTLLLPWVMAAVPLRHTLLETLRAQATCVGSLKRFLGRIDPVVGALGAIAVLLFLAYALNLFVHPIMTWDAVARWLFKAKLYFIDQRVDPSSSALAYAPPPDPGREGSYPPLYPLTIASIWVIVGRVSEPMANAINLVALIAVVSTMYSFLQRLLNPRLAAAMVFLFLALPTAMHYLTDGYYFGYADYVLASWMVLALLYLQAGATLNVDADVMAVTCAAGAALTKNEGIPLLVFVVAALFARQMMRWRQQPLHSVGRHLSIAGACVLPVIIWEVSWKLAGTHTPVMLNPDPFSLIPDLPSRAATIVNGFIHDPTRQNAEFWILLALPLCVLLLAGNRFRTGLALPVVVLLQLLTYFAVYLFTPIDLELHLRTSIDRVFFQITPAVILLLGVSLAPYVKASGHRDSLPEISEQTADLVPIGHIIHTVETAAAG